MNKLIVKSRNGCEYCSILFSTLDELGIEYIVDDNPANKVVPQVYLNDQLVFNGLPHMLDLLAFLNGL